MEKGDPFMCYMCLLSKLSVLGLAFQQGPAPSFAFLKLNKIKFVSEFGFSKEILNKDLDASSLFRGGREYWQRKSAKPEKKAAPEGVWTNQLLLCITGA